MMHYYETSKYKTVSEKSVEDKRKATIIKFPTDLMNLNNEDKEGWIGGIRNVNHR